MNVLWPKFNRGGLVTVVTIDRISREVLMVASANAVAYLLTLETGMAHYWSTSRKKIWQKGEISGNRQVVYDVLIDCDGDSLVYEVFQQGAGACHTGAQSCFFRSCVNGTVMAAPKAGEEDALEEHVADVCTRLADRNHHDEEEDESWKSATHAHKI